ncbi:MAG: RNA 2',3'-cyclic phosphodiesterase [Candidatus Neomarinimicrobiota bacterium]|jgi:2'-5' RNA ligase
MSEKRIFIAIPLPEKVKEELGRVRELLDPLSEGIKWTDIENLHITLKFLGETPEWVMDDVRQEFKRICSGLKSFQLQLSDLTQFPKTGDPRILLAGLQKVPALVYKLSDELNTGFLSMGYDDTGKKFLPHITLGRVKQKIHEDFLPAFYDIPLEDIVFTVDKIVLYESKYQRDLKYLTIEECKLL